MPEERFPEEHRQLDVLQSRGARKEIEALKDETDFLTTNVGAFVFRHRRDVLAIQHVTREQRLDRVADTLQ